MADYNIYIHTVGTSGNNSSPTTPFQLRGTEQTASGSGESIDGGFSPSTIVQKGAAFISNPDSAIGAVMASTIGKIGIAAFVVNTVTKITDKALTMYNNYATTASGNYKFSIEYNNYKTALHNALTPFSTEVNRQLNQLQINKENAKNEQERMLLGGTIINAPYGRYL